MSEYSETEGDFILSAREQYVVELVAKGFSAKEIAKKLAVKPRTVEHYIEVIRLKLRARNSPHMVACAYSQGLLKAG